MDKLNKDETKWNKLKENIKQIIDSSKENIGTGNTQDTIKVLFDHLKEIATICKDNNTNEACDSSKKETQNLCGDKRGAKHRTVKQIAQYYKRIAHKQLNERGSRSALKGDASQGQYDRGGKADDFKDICKITKDHSNSTPGQTEGPCAGKDSKNKMFEMEYGWTPTSSKSITHNDVYMPPRREHFCTSNLEHLDIRSKGLTGDKVNNSFLGDVLLSAKYEAENIKKKYENQPGYNEGETMCRAIKYSFADLGDIIRGRDRWDLDVGSNKMDVILKNVFGTLYKSLDGIKENPQYADDERNIPAYKLLREDWWEANRHQVWRAMKCHIEDLNDKAANPSSSDHCGYSDHTPLDDYIPQKLRWMTEWAEWFCKAQGKHYLDMVGKCSKCKEK
ncbi:hypothetical protein PFMALIP_05884, partial [Plasmodium falciparum MaliPS096_E11]